MTATCDCRKGMTTTNPLTGSGGAENPRVAQSSKGIVVRRIVGILSALAVAAAGLALAAPARAADLTATCTGGNTSTSVTAAGTTYSIEVGASCGSAQWTTTFGSGVTATKNSSSFSSGAPTSVSPGDVLTFTGTGVSALVNVVVETALFSNSKTVNITFNSGGGGGGGGGGSSSSSTSTPAPALETLTLAASTGDTTCTGGNPTGYTGSWLQMPAADACSQSGPNANPNAKLLGWATDPIFPVAVAQEIVDLRYGPIDDYFYGMRMIFIPAGGWTYISSSNTLYPIWAS